MSVLTDYVEQKNRWTSIFGNPPLSLAIAKDRQKIADYIDSELSPENLTCDGELRGAQVQQRYRMLTTAAKQLLQVDPAVKFYEYEGV